VECLPEQWISEVFSAWRQAGLRFVVLRNYDGLPATLDNDLDVLVEPERISEAESLLVKAIHACGGRIHNRAAFSPVSLFFHHPNSRRQYHVDLFHNLLWRGCVLLDAEHVLSRARMHGDIPVPAAADEAVLNLLTRLLYGGYIRDKYKSTILLAVQEHGTEISSALHYALGKTVGTEVFDAVASEQWSRLERRVKVLRLRLMLRALRSPWRAAKRVLRDAQRLLIRAVRVPGMVVVFIGPDGCGKTSVGSALKQRLAGTFYEEYTTYLHWKPRLMSNKAAGSTPFGVPCTTPHGKPLRPPVVNQLYVLAHVLEIVPAWWLRVRPRLFRNMLVMIDRYYYDFMVDPRRYRLEINEKWAWLLYRFVPKPDLVFCLTAPAEVIQSRKMEVTLEETERQRAAYEAAVARLPNGYIIDTNRPLEEVVDEVEDLVLTYLRNRSSC